MNEINEKLDSDEELYFYWWLSELKENGYIDEFILQPEPFTLSVKMKMTYFKPMKRVEDKELSYNLINGHIYTTDARIVWNKKAENVFYKDLTTELGKYDSYKDAIFIATESISYVEVKPKFDFKNMTRLAKTNIKWVWDKYGIFVNLVIPERLFKLTFTPDRFLTGNKSNRLRKINYKPIKTLKFYEISKKP